MISNRILQTTVDGLKAISRVDLCIVDADKNVAAKTFDNVSECLTEPFSLMFLLAGQDPAYVQQLAGYPLTGCPSAVQFLEMLYNAVVRG